MRLVRAALWTALAVGFGVFIATYEVFGAPPLTHLERRWERERPGISASAGAALERLRTRAVGLLLPEDQPREHHTPADRRALEALIAKTNGKEQN